MPDMNIYCPHCGRIIPADAKLCAYCGRPIPVGQKPMIAPSRPEKSKSTNILVIIVIIIAVVIVATIAIAATVYVYVSGMVGPSAMSLSENATVLVSDSDERYIEITLVNSGDNYGNGYTDVIILIENLEVNNLHTIYPWTLGEKITIGKSSTGFSVNGNPLDSGEYDVSVTILDTLVFLNDIEIT